MTGHETFAVGDHVRVLNECIGDYYGVITETHSRLELETTCESDFGGVPLVGPGLTISVTEWEDHRYDGSKSREPFDVDAHVSTVARWDGESGPPCRATCCVPQTPQPRKFIRPCDVCGVDVVEGDYCGHDGEIGGRPEGRAVPVLGWMCPDCYGASLTDQVPPATSGGDV